MNILELPEWKKQRRRLTMVTCYDAWSAKILNDTGVDMLLVGDSSGMVMHGLEDTIPVTMEMMVPQVAAVHRGAPKKFIVADLPFLAFRSDLKSNLEAVQKLMQAGAQAVKLEGYDQHNHELVAHLAKSGVPVVGHLGLTPQFVHAFGGFRVQGRSDEQRRHILEQARGLEQAGCFAIVLECVPQTLAAEITSTLSIPTIGIGAGLGCDGQVLVLHDLLGFTTGFKPKFVRNYMNGAELMRQAVENFREDVVSGRFPSEKETYE
ncbi:MAG: 3-methyl-2-oxobutanoate hydroxymethyltransferase [Bdellovibrionales bacterium]|nr:3-methyl-2-oxobutanoate hydroxymethyltransferase [Bdellovibrionales bacterium]